MAKEIERKFLVKNDGWRQFVTGRSTLRQAYLASLDDRSVRVRLVNGTKAMLTIKIGKSAITRDEFEYEIPIADAEELLASAMGIIIEKKRYHVPYKGFLWEVDVFAGHYRGLVIAEVEMQDETDDPELPGWLGREVTGDFRYSNQALATQFEHDRHGVSNTA